MRQNCRKIKAGKKFFLYISMVVLVIASLPFLFSCTSAVDIGEANKVLTSFSIVWPAGFENKCITGVPIQVTINALDQFNEVFTSWSGNVSIEKEYGNVQIQPETVDIVNGSKQVDLSITVLDSEDEKIKIRVRYEDISSGWSAEITVEYVFSIATIDPADGSILVGHQKIVISFNDDTDRNSLVLGGDLQNATPEWESVNYTDDKLTLSANSFWPEGDGKTLTIQCDISSGGQTADANLSYDVFHGMFVRTTDSDDSYTGTADQPKKTIKGAIEGVVAEGYSTAAIRIAEGTYESDYNSSDESVITMVEGISVYGGYSENDWDLRDTETYETIIEDTSSSGGSTSVPNRAIYCDSSITTSTIIDGLSVKMGKGAFNSAIYCEGSPTIQNSSITGRSSGADAGPEQIGIFNRYSTASPIIQNNTIDAGWNSNTEGCESIGIYNMTDASPLIKNCTMIDGGDGDLTYAIYNSNADLSPYPRINNNTLDSGSGSEHNYCIYIFNSRPSIDGNELSPSAIMTSTYGIFEGAESNCDPEKVRNNNFNFNWGFWYYDEGGSTQVEYDNWDVEGNEISTIEGSKLLLDAAWGNYSIY